MGFSFGARLLLLLGFLALGAAIDRWRNGRAATRPREYSWLLGVGALGALFGLCVDQVTSRLSVEYFVLGKGIDPGTRYERDVLVLSLQAGFTGGLAVGGVLLVCNRNALPLRRLLRSCVWPLAGAIALAPVGGLLARAFDPLGLADAIREQEPDPGRRAWFATVWGIHCGIYAGGLVGVIAAGWRLRRSTAREVGQLAE